MCHKVGLDCEGNEAVISLNVPLEDLRTGPEDALETGPVQLHAFERTSGHDRGRTGSVEQQRYLT